MTDSAATTITIILGVVDTLVGLAQFFLELAKFRLERAASKPAAGHPPPPRAARSEPNMARAFVFGVVLATVIYAFFDNPTGRAMVAIALLVVLLAMWAIRKAGGAGPPSGAFLDFLAILIGQSVILTILAIPLPEALSVPQFVVAAVVSGLVVAAAMRRIDPV